jgi:two-component system sensor histidine kinase/response regulator
MNNRPMLFNPGLSRHVLMWFLLFALIPLTLISSISHFNAQKLLDDYAKNELTDISLLHSNKLINELEGILKDITLESQVKTNVDFLQLLMDEYSHSKLALKAFTSGYNWAILTEKHGVDLHKFWEIYGYHDILLIDSQGNILFSIAHEDDLGTNLFSGPYSGTHFAQTARKSLNSGKDLFSDLEFYQPSANRLTGFVVSPLLDDQGNKIGLLAFQLS